MLTINYDAMQNLKIRRADFPFPSVPPQLSSTYPVSNKVQNLDSE